MDNAMENKSERFELRLQQNLSDRLDNWRKKQNDLPSKSEAVRRLVETALQQDDRKVTISDGEKLILVMISDIYQNLNIKNGQVNPFFIFSTLLKGHHWALAWAYPGLFPSRVHEEATALEVYDILEMWGLLEIVYMELPEDQQSKIKSELDSSDESFQFPGFDSTNEKEHLSIAQFLIYDMNDLGFFKEKNLDSHSQKLNVYRRMLNVYKPMRETPGFNDLSTSQIITLMKLAPHRQGYGS